MLNSEYLNNLNENQKEAVLYLKGPLLIVAGAGSGKTRVLTSRIAHIIKKNEAFPNQILAVTFTNKASKEMQIRVSKLLKKEATGLPWLGTFHSISAKLLRKHADAVGLKYNFSIIDQDDQIRLIKNICKSENIDTKKISPKYILSIIDQWKNKGWYPEDVVLKKREVLEKSFLSIYKIYQSKLLDLNACDFGDLILHSVKIFEKNPDIAEMYSKNFKYILVDEYQDTNFIQSKWLNLLAEKNKNICCVGDDDQSIYSWRGAEISNILRFEKDFPNAKVIRLEENYRSTGHILTAASKLIENNESRLGKTLWTNSGQGEKIVIKSVWDGEEEARQITSELEKLSLKNYNLDETAILVRASFQMREFEDRFISVGLPYKVIGGPRFYERKEIRDVNAYLRIALQPNDSLALERIINTPKRGIGETTLKKIRDRSKQNNLPMIDSIKELMDEKAFKGKADISLKKLIGLIFHWNKLINEEDKIDIAEIIVEDSGYLDMLRNDKSLTAEGRVDNVYGDRNLLCSCPSMEEFS